MTARRPNILFLHAHDMGRCNAVYGFEADTPNMASLAKQSAVFTNAHCVAPTCSPSRAGMLTGETAHQSGMEGLLHRGFSLRHPERHLAHWLREAGYCTALSGIQHELTPAQVESAYEHILLPNRPAHPGADDVAAAEAARFISEPHSRPWFCWLGLFLPHRPFLTSSLPDEYLSRIQVPPHLPDTPEVRRDLADYTASVQAADRAFGRALHALQASGQAQNTMVVLTTDHGIAFPMMKCKLTSQGTGVTLFIREPSTHACRIDALVSHFDIFPTLCELLSLPEPDWLLGKSLLPLMRAEQEQVHESIFAEVNCHAVAEPMRALRTREHLLIEHESEESQPAYANMDDSPSKSAFLEAEDFRKRLVTPRYELFDLQSDPDESVNIADCPSSAAILTDMQEKLRAWMERTDDPLLKGPYRAPRGARLNHPTALSPKEPPMECC